MSEMLYGPTPDEVEPAHPRALHAVDINESTTQAMPVENSEQNAPDEEQVLPKDIENDVIDFPLVRVLEQDKDAVPDAKIREYHDLDSKIHANIERARENVATSLENSRAINTELREDSTSAIEMARQSFEDKYAEAKEIKEALIASLEEQFEVVTNQLSMQTLGYITEHERVIEAVDDFEKNSEEIAASVNAAIAVTETSQKQHEAQRDAAINNIDIFIARRTELTSELENARSELSEVTAQRVGAERAKELLLDARTDLRTKEDAQLKKEVHAYQYSLPTKYFQEGTEAYEQAINELKQQIRTQSVHMIAIAEEVKLWEEESERNKEVYNMCTTRIAELKRLIGQIENELEKIKAAMEDANGLLAYETELVANDLETKSKVAVFVTGALNNVNRGDMDAVAGSPLPKMMLPLWDKKVAVMQAANVVNGEDPLKDFQAPKFDIDMDLLLQLTPGDPTSIIDGMERVRTAKRGNDMIEDIRRGTGADIAKAGASMAKAVLGRLTKPRVTHEYKRNEA